jgi:hypothetical protein
VSAHYKRDMWNVTDVNSKGVSYSVLLHLFVIVMKIQQSETPNLLCGHFYITIHHIEWCPEKLKCLKYSIYVEEYCCPGCDAV